MAQRITELELRDLERGLMARIGGSCEYDAVEQVDYLTRAALRLLAEVKDARAEEPQARTNGRACNIAKAA